MRYALLVLFAFVLVAFAACGLMSPEEQQTALDTLDQMLASKVITPAQYEALRETIMARGTGAWWEQAAQVVGGAALAWLGVRLDRGAPERVRSKKRSA